jgi:hypothetical protein
MCYICCLKMITAARLVFLPHSPETGVYMSGTPARRYRAAKRDAHHIINSVAVVRFYRFSFYVSVYILD